MAKKATITKNKYDKTHMKQYLLKYHLVNDADIIEKLSSVPNTQGYIRQLIREDIARTCPGSVPVSVPKNEMEEKTMNNKFYDRVLREGIVDTKQYRYAARTCYDADEQRIEIRRLPIKSLDTTDAIDGWETVKVIK